jgi:transcription antitermination factor NusG
VSFSNFRFTEPSLEGDWYALYTRHQHEKTVAWLLSAKGFEIFLPLYTALRRSPQRVRQVTLPLFPSYVFLRGGLDRWLQIVTTPGVCTIVGSGSGPAAVPAAEIEAIRQVLDGATSVEPHPFLKCGDRVRVTSGPLAGLEGILVRKRNLFRLVISIEMLGRSAAVEVDAAAIESLGSRNPAPQTRASAHTASFQHAATVF